MAQIISLGYGKYVRSDEVVAVEPITESRGPRRRALVWVRGLDAPLVASRSEGAIIDDLTTPGRRSITDPATADTATSRRQDTG